MAKSTKSSASTWRRNDAAFRKQQKERRDANIVRRQFWADVALLIDAGFVPEDFSDDV